MDRKIYQVVGLMSGTSMDGIDAAMIRTDGQDFISPDNFITLPYSGDFREKLRGCLGLNPGKEKDRKKVREVEAELTRLHADAVNKLIRDSRFDPADIDLIGFHGHTVNHKPDEGWSWQIGDGQLLANLLNIDVVNDFRTSDVKSGGQGAPLAPLYHQALAAQIKKPLAVLNLGGVGNITYIGDGEDEVIAFDTGPGNALLDDWVLEKTGETYDKDGRLAQAGTVDYDVLSRLLDKPYFDSPPPKSLDRNHFDRAPVAELSPEDGAATLVGFTVQSVVLAQNHLPEKPQQWLVTGGGRRNKAIMEALRHALGSKVQIQPVEKYGWKGDAIEAQAFGWLAVRTLHGLPLSLPSTTGVENPRTGGQIHRPLNPPAKKHG